MLRGVLDGEPLRRWWGWDHTFHRKRASTLGAGTTLLNLVLAAPTRSVRAPDHHPHSDKRRRSLRSSSTRSTRALSASSSSTRLVSSHSHPGVNNSVASVAPARHKWVPHPPRVPSPSPRQATPANSPPVHQPVVCLPTPCALAMGTSNTLASTGNGRQVVGESSSSSSSGRGASQVSVFVWFCLCCW